MIKAVIFDMDGVLIDSEPVYLDHMYQNLKLHYPGVDKHELYRVVGASSKNTRKIVCEAVGETLDSPAFQSVYAHLWDGCRPDYPSILREAVPGLLKEIKARGFLLALASSTSREGIEEVLISCRIQQYFDYMVSGDEFKESKPNPEIYFHTAGVLGYDPSECFVVEDSTYGIQAAHSAGMTVAALIDERFGFDRTPANFSISSLDDVLPLLDHLKETP